MRALFALLALAILPLPVEASASILLAAFQAHVKVRELEDEIALLPERTELEGEKREQVSRSLTTELTVARQRFRSAISAPAPNSWEKRLLERLGQGKSPSRAGVSDAEALGFLAEAFPNARNLRPLEWRIVTEWFGTSAQEKFLRSTFAMEEAGKQARLPAAKDAVILWVTNPYERFLPKEAAQRRQVEAQVARDRLHRDGYEVEILEVNPFPRLDDQAEDLHHALRMRLERGPVLLLSTEEASAVVHRALDLNPELLQRREIRGWWNVNGKLFGDAPDSPARRKPASLITPRSPAALPQQQARREMLLLYREGLQMGAPLGARFPVVNLVTLESARRAAGAVRESLESEGRTFYVTKGSALDGLVGTPPAAGEKK